MADTIEIHEVPQPLGLFAGDLFDRASEYLEAFELLAREDESKRLYASYFLMSHSLELMLKSFLAAKGVTKRELCSRVLGHDLEQLFKRSIGVKIPHIEMLEILIKEIQKMNSDHDFRYPSGYNLFLPSPRLCLGVLHPLKSALVPIVSSARLAGC